LLSERPHQWEHEQNCQNADKYLFWFHDCLLPQLNRPFAKTRMRQKHNSQLANFDLASLRVIWFCWGAAFGLAGVAGTSK